MALLEPRYCKTYEIVLHSDLLMAKCIPIVGTQNLEESGHSSF